MRFASLLKLPPPRPQLFEVSSLVVDARVIALPNHMRHIHISQTAFLSAVPDDEVRIRIGFRHPAPDLRCSQGEGVLETVEITFLSIAQVALSAAASGEIGGSYTALVCRFTILL